MAKALKGVWLFLLYFLLVSCSPGKITIKPPQATSGLLNLQGWDFNKNGKVSLSGEWAFYWQKLLSPSQFAGDQNFIYVPVPDYWTSYKISGQALPPEGFATYRLILHLPDKTQTYGLFIDGEGTAYSLWVDGELIAQNGQVATNQQDMIPQSKPLTVFFQPHGDKTELVIQISNWQHRKAGFRDDILLGLATQIHDYQSNEKSFDETLMGIYLVMALYHLFIYGFRPSDKSPLYFSLMGLLYFVRTGLLNQKLLVLLLPAMSWGTALRIEYLTFYLVSPIYTLFIQSIYPKDVPRWVMRTVIGLAVIFVCYMFFIDTLSLSYTTTTYQVILLIEMVYFIFFIGRIVARKREGAYYIAFASLIAFAGGTIEILSLQNIIPIQVNGTITFLAFIFIQAILLSSRLSKSFHRVEVLSGELEEANISLYASEKKYRSIFEEAKDMIFIAGIDEQIRDANPSSLEILGYTRDELKQMKMSDLIVHPEDRDRIKKILSEQLIVRNYELELHRKDHSTIHGLVTLILRRDETGRVAELQGSVQDISARKQADSERMRALEFEQLAITDPLTEIYNRRFFDEIVVKEWERARRSNSLLSVVIFDIDHFKKINDKYGHLTGDQVLINLAALCKSNVRSMDIFARYGGEEFIILMPDTHRDSTHQTIERLRTSVAETSLATFENEQVFVTISAGIVNWNGKDMTNIHVLLERADRALYISKQTGRNRVTIWESE